MTWIKKFYVMDQWHHILGIERHVWLCTNVIFSVVRVEIQSLEFLLNLMHCFHLIFLFSNCWVPNLTHIEKCFGLANHFHRPRKLFFSDYVLHLFPILLKPSFSLASGRLRNFASFPLSPIKLPFHHSKKRGSIKIPWRVQIPFTPKFNTSK